ncbi:MAG: hypothetical protein Q7T56_18120 [Nocardioidaceae bacterium]|nr:hypothetical protein [Nocardioidaceae bacterium]
MVGRGRRSARLLVHTADGMPVHDADGGRVTASRREVVAAVRTRLAATGTPPGLVDVVVEDGRLVAVGAQVACPWGVDLRRAGEDARAEVLEALLGVLGRDPDFDHDRGVRVQVSDVSVPD